MADWTTGGKKGSWTTSGSSGSVTKSRESSYKAGQKQREEEAERKEEERKRKNLEASGRNPDGTKKDTGLLSTIGDLFNSTAKVAEGANDVFLKGGAKNAGYLAGAVGNLVQGKNAFEGGEAGSKFVGDKILGEQDGVTALDRLKSDGTLRTGGENRAYALQREQDARFKAGQAIGKGEEIATDLATAVIPGAAVEKALKGTRAIQALEKTGRAGRLTSEVARSVAGGAAGTAVAGAVKPENLKETNFAENAALDAGLGLLGAGASSGFRALKNARKGKEVVDETKQLATGDAAKQLPQGTLEETQPRQLSEVTDTGMNERYAALDKERQELDAIRTGKYREQDFADAELTSKDNASRLMNDEQYIKGRDDLTKGLIDAEDSLKQYNDYIVSSPYHRQIDALDQKSNDILARKEADLEQARQIVNDPSVTDPAQAELNYNMLAQEIDSKYADELSGIELEHQRLAEKYPQDAMEAPILRQSMDEATRARAEAQLALEKHEADSAARVQSQGALERQSLREQELSESIAAKESELEQIKARKETPARTVSEAEQKIQDINTGNYTKETHPEFFNEDGSLNKQNVINAKKDLADETIVASRKEVLDKDPRTVPNEELVPTVIDDLADNIKDKKLTIGNMWSKGLLSVDEFLQSIGAQKLADNLEMATTLAHRSKADDKAIFRTWLDQAKGDDTSMLWKAADGNAAAYATLSDGGKKVVDSWKVYAKQAADELGLPEDARISEYIPHIFDKKNLNDGDFVPEGLARILKKNDKGNVNNKFLKKRTGATNDIQEDFWQAIEAYSEQKARKVHIEPATKELMEVASKVSDKQLNKYLTNTADHLRGIKDNPLDETLNNLTGGKATPAMRTFKNLVSPAALWFNPSSAVNSLAQMSNVTTELGPVGTTKAMFKANNLLGKVAGDKANIANLSKDEADMWRSMHRDGIFEGDTASLVTSDLKSKATKRANDAGFMMIKGADRYMRIVSYVGAYDQAIAKGLKGEKAAQYARRTVNKANFNFDSMRVPPLFRSQAARSMGTLVTFMPGMLKYTADIGGGAAKATKNIATGKYSKEDKEALIKAMYFTASAVGMSSLINGATSNGKDWTPDVTKIVPNPLDENNLTTPAIAFLTGTDTKVGLKDAITTGGEDDLGELKDFVTKTLPSTFIPGFGQANKMLQAKDAIDSGVSQSGSGNVQFSTEGWDAGDKASALLFGKYNSKEGRDYVRSIGDKRDDGSALPASLSQSQTRKVYEANPENRREAIDFYQQAKKITGHSEASKRITELLDSKQPRKAERIARDFNDKVDNMLESYYNKYPDMAEELRNDLNKNIYINTKRITKALED